LNTYLDIFRKNRLLFTTAGTCAIALYTATKKLSAYSGNIERDLARVTIAKIGSSDPFYSRVELLARLKSYRSRLYFNIFNAGDSITASRLDNAIVDMENDVSTGALRVQPYCIVLYGCPGVGKSSCAIQVARKLMKSVHESFNSFDMVTLNETDDFQSEFRSSHKVVLFDDLGASRPDANDTKNPWRKIIDFVNNVQKTALNPNCEMKGKVYIKPELVIITTNLDFISNFSAVKAFMLCPEAIQRRVNKVVELKNYEECSFIEYDVRTRGNQVALGDQISNLGHKTNYVPRELMLKELVDDFIKHNDQQIAFVNEFNDYFDDLRQAPERSTCKTDIPLTL